MNGCHSYCLIWMWGTKRVYLWPGGALNSTGEVARSIYNYSTLTSPFCTDPASLLETYSFRISRAILFEPLLWVSLYQEIISYCQRFLNVFLIQCFSVLNFGWEIFFLVFEKLFMTFSFISFVKEILFLILNKCAHLTTSFSFASNI